MCGRRFSTNFLSGTVFDRSPSPSKRIGRFRSVRVGLHYRALAVQHEADIVWFWVGPHAEYGRLAVLG